MRLGDRFWSKVDKSAGLEGCWQWTAAKSGEGYGYFGVKKEGGGYAIKRPHRLVINCPEGLFALHSCDNPSCVNPAHLRAGTKKENAADREERGRSQDRAGAANGRAKLSTRDVRTIRYALETGLARQSDVADLLGVPSATVNHIAAKRTWSHLD